MDALPERLTMRATSSTPSSEAPKQPSPKICESESGLIPPIKSHGICLPAAAQDSKDSGTQTHGSGTQTHVILLLLYSNGSKNTCSGLASAWRGRQKTEPLLNLEAYTFSTESCV